jgi:hypothetical protein
MEHLQVLSQIERHIQAASMRHTAKDCRVCCMAVELINDAITECGLDAALGAYRFKRANAGRAGEQQGSARERRDDYWKRVIGPGEPVVGPGPREST